MLNISASLKRCPTPGSREPIFPPELEREIMEETARSYPGSAVSLALVSRRARMWMETFIYETVTLSTIAICERFLYTMKQRPLSFFVAHVKSLCIPGDIPPSDAEKVLVVCQGVVNLACWPMNGPPLFHLVSDLRPKRLSINTSGMFGVNVPPDFRHPFFQNVTHLEIVDWLWCSWSGLEFIPCLTHLALDLDNYHDGVVDRLRQIMSSCRTLAVCICFVPSDRAMIQAQKAVSNIDDKRLVVLSDSDPLENWEASLKGDRGGSYASLWEFATAIVEDRSNDTMDDLEAESHD
ncbi:hypothetical protein BDN72DRAFT_841437 [Pluteus cervinus]|uniref:Uncharacterized protein n=1 Tax=Pluteus cervinus TaxID=181527 RepID=A0ACD3ASQ1_9AGAR|nr:hypothetical protein BDN72DRAFT_841437 [Pluteus cervinus]